MSRIDFKNGHRDILNRRAEHWQDGWRAESWAHGCLWGIAIVLAVIAFL